MFNENQIQKIKVFSTLTKINNDCFKKCVHFELKDEDNVNNVFYNNVLTNKEILCIKNCSLTLVKLRDFIESQLFEDFESVNKKNQNIFDKST